MTKGVSQKQQFSKPTVFSRQYWPKPEFHTKCHKSLARDFFSENKVSSVTFWYFNAVLNFLDGGFCLYLRNVILKVFYSEFTRLETCKIKFLRFKQKPPSRKFSTALKYQKVTEETLFSGKKSRAELLWHWVWNSRFGQCWHDNTVG